MAESNEQLAERIQAGETGLMGSLWEQLERFFHRRTGQFYRQHEAACRYAGVEPEDLLQSCFIALHKAVQDYKAESGYKLTTYLHRHMQGAFAEVCGYRSSKRDPLSASDSLDAPLSEEDATTWGDHVPDPAGEEEYRQAEEQSYKEALRRDLESCLDCLPDNHKKTLQGRYWKNKTYQEIAEDIGVNRSRARTLELDAIRALRRGKPLAILRQYEGRLRCGAWMGTGLQAFRDRQASSVEMATERAERLITHDVTQL